MTFSHTDWINFGHLSNLFREIFKLVSTWTDVHFEPKRSLGNFFFIIFGYWTKIFGFWSCFSKVNFTSPENQFQDNCFFLKRWHFFVTFADNAKSFGLPLSQEKDCHNCILHVPWNALRQKMQFWNPFCFLNLFQTGGEHFWPSCKIFPYGCQNCFRRVHRHTFTKAIFLLNKKYLCLFCLDIKGKFFRVHGKIVLAYCYIFSTGLSKLPSTCPEDSFRERFFSPKGLNIF